MVNSYTAYGLVIRSEFPLSALEIADEDIQAEITIRKGTFDRPSGYPSPGSCCLQVSPAEAILAWKNLGFFRICSGEEVIIDLHDHYDVEQLELIILGTVLAVLLHQRGYLVLHASAIAIDGNAIAFLGGSGWGKSTLAAIFQARNYDIVADDIVAVDIKPNEQPTIISGFPQLKLMPDVVSKIQSSPQEFPRLHPDYEKRAVRDSQNFYRGLLPLGNVYVLDWNDQDTPEITSIRLQDALAEIVRHSFISRLLERTNSQILHFQQCVALTKRVPIRRLARSKSLHKLSDLVNIIEADVKQ